MPHHQTDQQLSTLVLLTPKQMMEAEQVCMEAGIAGQVLMLRAAQALCMAITRRWLPCRVAVLCGPGNNGGDGYVTAHFLRQQGWDVQVFSVAARHGPNDGSDAAWAMKQWGAAIGAAKDFQAQDYDLVVDAVFGAGLNRALDAQAIACLQACEQHQLPICAVDMPSGIDGRTGQVLGYAAYTALTVTFTRAKPGHYLLPGKRHCGELVVADIGVPDAVVAGMACQTMLNAPPVWARHWPHADMGNHKYKRGHVVVLGGDLLTGAARLAAQAAQRVGAGLVSVAAPESAWSVYAQSLQSVMVQGFSSAQELRAILQEPRRNVCLIGPGAGVHAMTRQAVLDSAQMNKQLVIDADALTAFADQPELLFAALGAAPRLAANAYAVLTPHDGEFARLFGHLSDSHESDKCARSRQAALTAQAVVIVKGSDTVIAAPDGRVAINANAPATLASGGTGDVLAGMIAGLLAQGMPGFEAACAAVWLHGRAAHEAGAHLIADDLLQALQNVSALH